MTAIFPATSTNRSPVPHDHVVQFYEEDALLYRMVADFLADGLIAFEPAVAIGTREHLDGISERLSAKGFDVASLRANGQLIFRDARELMATYMNGRMPDEEKFRLAASAILEESVRGLDPATPIRAFGEMVDLLWRDGMSDAALRLESLWNELAQAHSFKLLCAYQLGNFYREHHGETFDAICRAHSSVLPAESRENDDRDMLLRRLATLEQRAQALKTEIVHRQQLEQALRGALAERWEAEEALRRSERELKDFLENATIGLHWVGPDGRILWANDAELSLLGYTREEYIGQHVAKFHADRATIEDILATLVAGREIRERDARLLAKDGSIRHVSISSSVMFEDGKFIHTRCFTRDVTEQKRLEEERAFLLDATTVLNQSLDYASRLRELAQLVVPRLADWCAVDIAREDGTFERVATTQVDAIVSADAETTLVVPMNVGERLLGRISLAGHRCSTELATELARRAAIAIENSRLYGLAQQGNRAKDEFLATLSHELRTPLTAILGWARMLRMGPLDPEVTATALETIERSATTQAALIDDILDLSKVVSGKISLQMDLVNLVSIVENTIETVRLAATAKRVTVDFHRPAAPAFVTGDPTRLQQIVWNLLSNAIKFSRPDSAVTIEVERTRTQARLIVRDEGCGIRATFLPHVFEPFRQAEASTTRSYGGLGLGLAIVKYFVELHGGSIAAESAGEGHGATFSVALPLSAAAHPAPPAEQAAAMVDLRGTAVLIVDDDDDTRGMIAAALRSQGADVRTASSVTQACLLLEQRRPDVLVTDIAMPERDGFALIDFVRRRSEGLTDLPVVALTALGRPEDQARVLAAGFTAYAKKPVEPSRLTEIVSSLSHLRPLPPGEGTSP